MSKQVFYIPYKHILIIAALSVIAFFLYTPKHERGVDDNATVSPAVPLDISTVVQEKSSDEIIDVVTPKSPKVLTTVTDASSTIDGKHSDDRFKKSPAIVVGADANANADSDAPSLKSQEDKVVIRQGDVLSVLFDRYNLGQTALRHLLSADESLLALDTLRPEQILFFRYKDNTQYLEELELYKHPAYRVIYRRMPDGGFSYEVIRKKGDWHNERVSGVIEGSFYLSAQRAGLTEAEAATVTRIFQEQLNFSRAIRKGDKFQIVRGIQTINGQPTGQTRIDSARIQRRAYEHTAFLFDDGRYYDKQGQSLARAFTRTPLAKSYRVSSPFNPRRKHPVTGRVGPHNGTDFATPLGTEILSTGDGVVSRVGNHPYAGRYIDIQHGGQYKTRYLHLHRVLVRKGESITRGQIIALSGNSGRSTGPHLHFELHVYGRPVDPMKASIPMARSIPKKHRLSFERRVNQQIALLDAQSKTIKLVGNTGGFFH
jgi:murein DD-endopeptidase MepM/ murein hydrolase activator NlpD